MGSVTFSTAVGGDGSTVTDDDNATTGLRNGGWRTRFVPALTQEVAVAGNVVTNATAALASKNAAASSATAAAGSATTSAAQATNSSNSATASASSATASASSATSAAASATSANNSVAAIATAFSSPTPIGNTAANTGAFTTLSASGQTTLNGRLGIGSAPAAGVSLTVASNITGSATGRGVWVSAPIQSDVTTNAFAFATNISTAAAAFTLPSLFHYYAGQAAIGAGSTITNQYGFFGNIPAGTGRYNLYMASTADNYLAGDLQLSKTVTATGTTGARTINSTTGTVNFAAAATSLVVTNSLVTVNSIIIAAVGTNDATMKSVQAVAAAGSFTLYASAAATAETRVNFHVTN